MWMCLGSNSSSFLISTGFTMRMHIHTSFLAELRQTYCFTLVLGGLGRLRGDVTGIGKPSADLQDSPANVGNLKISAGRHNTQYSILNTQYSISNNTQSSILNKYRGLWSYSLVLSQITTNYKPLYQFCPSLWTIHTKKKKEYLNTITLKLHFTYKFWKVTEKYPLQISYKRRGYCRQQRMFYTHTPSGWCSGVLTNTRWKRAFNISGCGIFLRDSRY